jgi:hypothetical protein
MSEPRTLMLHRTLYDSEAIDRAITTYAGHATITRSDSGDHVRIVIERDPPARAERIARELANFALGLTIQTRGGVTGGAT